MLGELRPGDEDLRLFRAVAVDAWRAEEADTVARRQGLEHKVADLKSRKRRLVDAFVYRQAIDEATYQEETARIAEDLTAAETALQDARLDEIDAEAAVDFAVMLVSKADRMWIMGDLEQRQRLQAALYPDGVTCREGCIVRTAPNPLNFMDLDQPAEAGSRLVSPTGFEPVLLP
jgi:hypothetical protein